MSLPAGTHIGKYIIQRKLAEGGMAEIFLASSFGPEGFEKQVVIKRIRPTFADDASFVEMFVSEARLVSKLNHANIVQIFDFDRHDDTFYIAMEYVRGKSLAQAHQRARELGVPLAPALAAQIVVEVARGLGFAHRLTDHGQPLGLVHRDVTPQNILLSYEGAVKLTDFGIAKAGTRASTVGMLKGKFAYMSPEQSRGQPVDARTDIFALGITLWELLSAARLFDADSDVAVLHAVQERTVRSPSELNPAVGADLSGIVMHCLEREKGARFQTAQELERALSRYLATAAEETDVGAWIAGAVPSSRPPARRTPNFDQRRPFRVGWGRHARVRAPQRFPSEHVQRPEHSAGPALPGWSAERGAELSGFGPCALHDAGRSGSPRGDAGHVSRGRPGRARHPSGAVPVVEQADAPGGSSSPSPPRCWRFSSWCCAPSRKPQGTPSPQVASTVEAPPPHRPAGAAKRPDHELSPAAPCATRGGAHAGAARSDSVSPGPGARRTRWRLPPPPGRQHKSGGAAKGPGKLVLTVNPVGSSVHRW